MTKARTKAAKRRAKKARPTITLPGGMVVPQTATHSRDRRMTHQPAEDPRLTVKAARAKLIPDGADPFSVMAGCAVGQRLMAETTGDRRARLWGATCHLRKVYAAYDRALGGPARYAQCLRILAPTEAMEAQDQHIPVDDRDEETRYRDAVRAWMTAQGWLGHVDSAAASACIRAVVDDQTPTDWPGIVLALECVADGMAGERIRYRGRGEK